VYPDPQRSAERFSSWLRDLHSVHGPAVLLPMTDVSVPLVLECRGSIENFRTALPSLEAYTTVSDKHALYELCDRANIRTPRTLAVARTDLGAFDGSILRFPLVIKPRRSATRDGEKIVKRSVRYARSVNELRHVVESMFIDGKDELLVQEYVDGTGVGLFVLYDRGRPVLHFSHRRLREKPPTGGVSVLSESVPLRQDLVAIARRILGPLNWHGVAMLEFKIDGRGHPWLLEINARLWGSLQLAIDSNVDFPGSLYAMALGESVAPIPDYKVGRRLRWVLGDLDSLYITLKQRDGAVTIRDKVAAVGRFCLPWQPGLRYELLRMSDPCPAVFAVREYLKHIAKPRSDDQ
jgi:predicted ATP-grasp superfamily ATP-dependent carboligase